MKVLIYLNKTLLLKNMKNSSPSYKCTKRTCGLVFQEHNKEQVENLTRNLKLVLKLYC